MQRLLLSQGLRAAHLSPDEFLELIHADDRRWAPLIDKIMAR
jgi:hypothetical protein